MPHCFMVKEKTLYENYLRGNYLFTYGFKPITLLKRKYIVFLIKTLNDYNEFRMFRHDRLRIGQ